MSTILVQAKGSLLLQTSSAGKCTCLPACTKNTHTPSIYDKYKTDLHRKHTQRNFNDDSIAFFNTKQGAMPANLAFMPIAIDAVSQDNYVS